MKTAHRSLFQTMADFITFMQQLVGTMPQSIFKRIKKAIKSNENQIANSSDRQREREGWREGELETSQLYHIYVFSRNAEEADRERGNTEAITLPYLRFQ